MHDYEKKLPPGNATFRYNVRAKRTFCGHIVCIGKIRVLHHDFGMIFPKGKLHSKRYAHCDSVMIFFQRPG